MTERTLEQEGEEFYRYIVKRSQDLTRRVCAYKETESLGNAIKEHRDLGAEYVAKFDYLNKEQSERASCILNKVQICIHQTFDVLRVDEMRQSLEELEEEEDRRRDN